MGTNNHDIDRILWFLWLTFLTVLKTISHIPNNNINSMFGNEDCNNC